MQGVAKQQDAPGMPPARDGTPQPKTRRRDRTLVVSVAEPCPILEPIWGEEARQAARPARLGREAP